MNLKRILALPLLLIVAGVALAACGSDSNSESGKIEVNDAWARSTPPGQTTGAIYAELKAGDSADQLLSASVPADVASKAEIHESMAADADMSDHKANEGQDHMPAGDHGNMKMKQVHSVDVPAGKTVELMPGGLHIMLFDLAGPLKAGQTVPVTLTFKQAGEIKVDATVRDE